MSIPVSGFQAPIRELKKRFIFISILEAGKYKGASLDEVQTETKDMLRIFVIKLPEDPVLF
jgi:hypothetical protein